MLRKGVFSTLLALMTLLVMAFNVSAEKVQDDVDVSWEGEIVEEKK